MVHNANIAHIPHAIEMQNDKNEASNLHLTNISGPVVEKYSTTIDIANTTMSFVRV